MVHLSHCHSPLAHIYTTVNIIVHLGLITSFVLYQNDYVDVEWKCTFVYLRDVQMICGICLYLSNHNREFMRNYTVCSLSKLCGHEKNVVSLWMKTEMCKSSIYLPTQLGYFLLIFFKNITSNKRRYAKNKNNINRIVCLTTKSCWS